MQTERQLQLVELSPQSAARRPAPVSLFPGDQAVLEAPARPPLLWRVNGAVLPGRCAQRLVVDTFDDGDVFSCETADGRFLGAAALVRNRTPTKTCAGCRSRCHAHCKTCTACGRALPTRGRLHTQRKRKLGPEPMVGCLVKSI